MKPITGTHIYSLFACARAVALDLSMDRSLRRPLRDDEEFVLARGREHEARSVATLDWPEPVYPRGDFATGAAATHVLLQKGVEGVLQGVLVGDGRLGIPDLLRREDGDSALGAWHYVVGDVKSSARPRGDQLLQVAFYSALLAELQGRRPEYGFLVLKDGREERFALADYAAALEDAVERVTALRDDPAAVQPFLSRACGSCRWSDRCLPELERGDDLSLVQGMTDGLRRTLHAAGVANVGSLAQLAVERVARRTHVEPARLRRLARAAAARLAGEPLVERPGRVASLWPAAFVHVLTDPFEERLLYVGVRIGGGGDRVVDACPRSVGEEWDALCRVLAAVPRDANLVHYGAALPRWLDALGHGRARPPQVEGRLIDLARRLRGVAVWPGPVFGLAEHVRFGLGRDPHRVGRASAAALLAGDEGWLCAKGAADLDDLAALAARWCAEGDVVRADAAGGATR